MWKKTPKGPASRWKKVAIQTRNPLMKSTIQHLQVVQSCIRNFLNGILEQEVLVCVYVFQRSGLSVGCSKRIWHWSKLLSKRNINFTFQIYFSLKYRLGWLKLDPYCRSNGDLIYRLRRLMLDRYCRSDVSYIRDISTRRTSAYCLLM